jgi:hypothetical protein
MANWNPNLKEGMEGLKKVIEADVPGKEFKPYQAPVSQRELAAKFPMPSQTEPAIKSVGRSVAGKVLGAVGGQVAGVLLNPTPAGEGSDKLPGEPGGPVPRAKGGPVKAGGAKMKNVDNSGMTKMKVGCK